jgi:hypothetical protein
MAGKFLNYMEIELLVGWGYYEVGKPWKLGQGHFPANHI